MPPRNKLADTSSVRTCKLFNAVRKWAYRERLRYDDRIEWEEVAYTYALAVNAGSTTPLSEAEVGHTARSVARWVWRNFSAEKFSAIQAARGRKGGQKGGRVVTEAKREANRRRATKIDRRLLDSI